MQYAYLLTNCLKGVWACKTCMQPHYYKKKETEIWMKNEKQEVKGSFRLKKK